MRLCDNVISKILQDQGWQPQTDNGFLSVPCPVGHLHSSNPTDQARVYINKCGSSYGIFLHCFHNSCHDALEAFSIELTKRLQESISGAAKEARPLLNDQFADLVKSSTRARKEAEKTSKSDEDEEKEQGEYERLLCRKSRYVMECTAYDWDLGQPCFGSPEEDFAAFLTMWGDQDRFWIGERFESGQEEHKQNFNSPEGWKTNYIPDKDRRPLTSPYSFQDNCLSRCAGAVKKQKYLVVEADKASFPEQRRVLYGLANVIGLPLKCVVHSGNKSLNGWFLYPNDDKVIKTLKIIFREDGLNLDCATAFTPSQPCRLPGGYRADKETFQRMLYFNPKAALSGSYKEIAHNLLVAYPLSERIVSSLYAIRGHNSFAYRTGNDTLDFTMESTRRCFKQEFGIYKDNEMDEYLHKATMTQSIHGVVQRIAGHKKGIHNYSSKQILVCTSSGDVEVKEGTFSTIEKIVADVLRNDARQITVFNLTLSRKLQAVTQGVWLPGQNTFLAGEINDGKSLLQHIISWLFGEEAGHPLQSDEVKDGAGLFTADRLGNIHVYCEDFIGKATHDAKMTFAGHLKQNAANRYRVYNDKYEKAFSCDPIQMYTFSLNRERLYSIPHVFGELSDKIHLFLCGKVSLPDNYTVSQKAALDKLIQSEMPAYRYYLLNDLSITPESALFDERMYVKSYIHPELKAQAQEHSVPYLLFEALCKFARTEAGFYGKIVVRHKSAEWYDLMRNHTKPETFIREQFQSSKHFGIMMTQLADDKEMPVEKERDKTGWWYQVTVEDDNSSSETKT